MPMLRVSTTPIIANFRKAMVAVDRLYPTRSAMLLNTTGPPLGYNLASAATTSRSLYDRFLSIRFITFIVKARLLILLLDYLKQRCLPRAFLFHYEPQDRPSNGLRSLPLVVPQRLLVARILLPLPLLAADLGGVLAASHNGVPLCSGPDGVGNSLVDDVLQCHTALTSG